MDDFVIVHPDKEYLKSLIPLIKEYLQSELSLELHPKKIYLQHYARGVDFLGTVIKPHRIYIRNRMKGNFYKRSCIGTSFSSANKQVIQRAARTNISEKTLADFYLARIHI